MVACFQRIYIVDVTMLFHRMHQLFLVFKELKYNTNVMYMFSALMYSLFGVVLSKARGADDELNTLTAAAATGMLYKSTCQYSLL